MSVRRLSNKVKMEDLPKRYKSYHSIEGDLNRLISENNGKFPTYKQLKEHNNSLLAVINRYGGVNVVREKMGYELETKPKKYWENQENLESELKKVISENNGKFPSQRELFKMGYSSLANTVIKYHRGFVNVRKKMGYEVKSKPSGYWKHFKNVKAELEKIIAETGNKFPTQKDLIKKFPNLARAIQKYHGGLNSAREELA